MADNERNPNNNEDEELLNSLMSEIVKDNCSCGECNVPGADVFAGPIPLFDNSDLPSGGELTSDEMAALIRLCPNKQVSDEDSDDVLARGLYRIYELCAAYMLQYELKKKLDAMNADTERDLLGSMLAVVGEMTRLRSAVAKILSR